MVLTKEQMKLMRDNVKIAAASPLVTKDEEMEMKMSS
jgi:hypothetical protein